MAASVKKELILNNLDCASCAVKIENQVKRLENVSTASMNFVTKTLTIEMPDDGNVMTVLNNANRIIQEIEQFAIVKEEQMISMPGKKLLILQGLDCANCAAKIEKAVKNIIGVKTASVDFTTKVLTLEASHKHELARIVAEASKLTEEIESGIKVVEHDQAKPSEEQDEGISIAKYIRLGAGFLFFIAAIAFKFDIWLELPLFLISYILVGGEVLLRAVKNIIRGQIFDENFLMSLATIGAFAIGAFPEAVAVMLFYEVGDLFEKLAVGHSRRSISALMDIRPDYANLKKGDDISKVSPDQVNIGDLIIVKPGEKVPLDGRIVEGTSMLDTSAITGESLPRDVKLGDDIYSGTINMNGLITVEVTKIFSDSTVSKILDLVQNASSKKAPTENFITRFARYYTPVVVFVALALAIIPPLIIPGATFSTWIYRALVFLVVSCPCALVISIPLGFFGGIGGASKQGILVKGSNYLEALNKVDTVVFDKTGTLTKGVFKVTKVQNELDTTTDLLELAAYAESYSNHPIALSILKAYGKEIVKSRIESYDEIPGFGIKVKMNGSSTLAGNAKFLQKEGISFSESKEIGTIVYLATNGQYAGYIVIADEIKEDAEKALKQLKSIGIRKLVMLTGDSKAVGEIIGRKLGFDKVFAELLPNQKVEKLEYLEKTRQTNGKLVFVGDGINDAPVLTRADVGIAMGGLGSDAAIEAADIVIMTDEPSKVATAILMARKTKRIIWQNIILAFVVKGVVLLLGAGGLATMWEAVFADIGVTLIAIFNAMRVLNSKKV